MLYAVNGRQVRSHLRRVGKREERTREQVSILEPKRADLGMSAFENNMSFILHIILGITKITGYKGNMWHAHSWLGEHTSDDN
eukprot:1137940-Pelagomonas_calceolata.AAC.1